MRSEKIQWMVAISLTGVTCGLTGQAHPLSLQHQTNLLFYQLSTADGLTDNYIYDMAIDSSGSLWLGTGDGLNQFNGKTVVKFFHDEYPQLSSNYIRQLVCDSHNRIWVLMGDGNVTVIDEERKFHRVVLQDSSKQIPVRRILYPLDAGIVLFVHDRHYKVMPDVDINALDSLTLKQFTLTHIEGFDTLYQRGFRQVEDFDDHSYLFVLPQRFYRVNYITDRVEHVYEIPDVFELARWDRDQVLVQDRNTMQLQVINLDDGTKSFPFDTVQDQHGNPVTAEILAARWIQRDRLLLTARRHGIYLYDRDTGLLFNHRHNAANPTSIVNNSPTVITTDKTGWVFIGCRPNGVSYYKSNAVVGQQLVFMDDNGNNYDGYINSIATQDNNIYYIGTSEYLIEWERNTNTSRFVYVDGKQDGDPSGFPIFFVVFDPRHRLWVAVRDQGVYVLDHSNHVVGHIMNTPGKPPVLPSNNIPWMENGPDGDMWLSTESGECRINIQSFAVDTFGGLPLENLRHTFCTQTWFSDPQHVWIATTKGAWEYDLSTHDLIIHNTENGMISNDVFCFNKDREGNIYIGTKLGMQLLLHDGRTKQISVEEGLMNRRVEALLLDDHDRMWIGNDVGVACFTMADTSVKVFDERYGLSVQGFRIASYHQNSDGELIWGTERGIQYFYPDRLLEQKVSLPTIINRIETRDVVSELTHSADFNLSPANNYVTFYFTSTDYSKHLKTFYEYQLEGVDEDWIKVIDQNAVRYSALRPGAYTFRVRASNDDREWEDASNTVTITIAKPLWNKAWFRLLLFLAGVFFIWSIINYFRRKQLAKQEELGTQAVINYFASRINSYRKTEDLLWDVAENCISKLHFEDCVIYLLDEQRNVLVQTAAFGPKMDKGTLDGRTDFSVHQPIEIPVGQGIVGTVAHTGKAELVGDTSQDARYIVDDTRRNAELAVPMMIDDKTIGVIDSEHSRKHFFTQKHMNILSTIAALCTNQIQRVRAEDEKQQAMIEVLKNKQKVTESRLQSLRLQMNPHFLFNALNSIQQMILANEEMVATRYLSRFSKLLRTILIHSDKEMVTLKEELEILNLYIDLESVRFKKAFEYEIICDDDLDIDEIKIPTLLIQPFVENAIWHGLMHKEGNRHLYVSFSEEDDNLHCIIEDNGIGRDKAREMKLSTGHGTNHTSKGIAVSVERLKSIYNADGQSGSMKITDLKDTQGRAAGTRVEIMLPVQN